MPVNKDTFNTFEILRWLPNFHLGVNPFGNLNTWPVWIEATRYIGDNKVLSSLSFVMRSKMRITAWPKLGIGV